MSKLDPLRVLIVDDHQMMRDGLRAVLEHEELIEVIAEAGDGRSALRQVEDMAPDLVVMDVALPDMNGIEATRQITAEHPEVRVIALSTYSDRRYVVNMLNAGASGYVLKESASDELLRAVEAVARGNEFLSPEITGPVVDKYVRRRSSADSTAFSVLGPREREVLQLLSEGLTTPKIAERLFIAPKTVETHRRNLTRKLGLKTIAELTKYAVREGLTSLEH